MGRYKTRTSNNVVIVALRKFLNTPWVTAGETSSGKEKTVYNIMGGLVWGFFLFQDLEHWDRAPHKKNRRKKKAKFKEIILPLLNTITPTLNVADAVEPSICVSVKNQ